MGPSFNKEIMASIYAGSTPKYLIKIKDENGVQLDPRESSQITEVMVYIYNSISGQMIAKFYLNAAPNPVTGWAQMTRKVISATDVRLLMSLTAAQTIAAEGNNNIIQINTHIPDSECEDGVRRIIKKGKFHEIKPAVQ